jgi:acetylornithine/succinyldiaminopimelate/putrescine aminotransferase
LSGTWKEAYQMPFRPLLPGFLKAEEYNNLASLEAVRRLDRDDVSY